MTTMLDGNAIAGTLADMFDAEMTLAIATCVGCGSSACLGEAAVYARAPGVVVRCRRCDNPLMIFVERRGLTCVDLRGIAALRSADQD
jgi:hypothetical protein